MFVIEGTKYGGAMDSPEGQAVDGITGQGMMGFV